MLMLQTIIPEHMLQTIIPILNNYFRNQKCLQWFVGICRTTDYFQT